MECIFCSQETLTKAFIKRGSVFVIEDNYPVSPGHLLIVPNRHISDFFEMSTKERQDSLELLDILKSNLQSKDAKITGFNIGMNCGEDAGQTIMHAHIHLIPRRKGDVDKPKGGIRGCIPGKMSY